VSLGLTAEKLRAMGVETVGVVGTPLERARRYFRYRPPRYPVGADGDMVTHRAFGVPRSEFTQELVQLVTQKIDALASEEGLAARPGGGWQALDRADGIDTAEHGTDFQRHRGQRRAQFLIDRDGVIRWSNTECARDGLEGLERFPSEEELLEVARKA
jgi:hypothetical protein